MNEGLDELLGLEEALEVTHLPGAAAQKYQRLRNGPPEDAGVGGFRGLPEPLLAVPLVVLLFGDLFHLVEQLADPELQLVEFVLRGHFLVVGGVLSDLNVQMHTQLRAREPGGAVRVQTNQVLAGSVRREREAALRSVEFAQDHLKAVFPIVSMAHQSDILVHSQFNHNERWNYRIPKREKGKRIFLTLSSGSFTSTCIPMFG